MKQAPCVIAKEYVDLSNEADLPRVFSLFDEAATYRSSVVGTYSGLDEIKEMMQSFFSKFSNIHWTVERYDLDGTDTASFDFVMTAGKDVYREGHEKITVNQAGLITHVEVLVKEE